MKIDNRSIIGFVITATLPISGIAEPNVTLRGFVKTGVASTKYSNGAVGNGSSTSVDDGGSRFIISGSEDLGGGIRGIFQIDTRFRADEGGGTLAAGTDFVGLTGNWGSIRLGRLDTFYLSGVDEYHFRGAATQASNISVLSWVGGVSRPAIARATRSDNVLRYDIPATGGFNGNLTYSTNPFGNDGLMGDAGKGQAWSAEAVYRNGPLAAGAAYWDYRIEGAPPSGDGQKAWRLHGSWNFGIARIGVTYDQSKIMSGGAAGSVNRGAWSVPVFAKLGSGTALFTYTQAQDLDSSTTGKLAGTGAKMYSIGYDYPFSKRTILGVSFSVLNNDTNANYAFFTALPGGGHPLPVGGQDQKQVYLGLMHWF